MSFQSVHDLLTPPGIIRKQRFWDFFDGDALRSWWTFVDFAGTGSGAMNDVKDGGYRITTGTSSSDSSGINFNDINHYAADGAVFIFVMKAVEATSRNGQTGFHDDSSFLHYSMAENSDAVSFVRLITKDGSTTSATNTSIAPDESYHKYKIALTSTANTLSLDDTLEAVRTSNLPTSDLQLVTRIITTTTAARSQDNLRFEAYNT